MAISIETHTTTAAPIILLYGPEGCGKTSLALDAPNPIYLPIAPEAPPWKLHPKKFAGIANYADVIAALRMLFKNPGNFQTLVIDSLSAIEPWVWEATCLKHKWRDIEAPGFGKGYVAADVLWTDLFLACRALGEKRGISTIFIAHSEAGYVDEPGFPPFNRHTIRLQKRGEAISTESCDAVWFMHSKLSVKSVDAGFGRKDIYAEGGGTRVLAADGRANYVAKNRFGMPSEVVIPELNPWSAVAPYLELPEPPPPDEVEPELPLTTEVKAGPPALSELVAKYEPQVNPPSTAEETSAALGGDTIPV
jgi:hypothetical protein